MTLEFPDDPNGQTPTQMLAIALAAKQWTTPQIANYLGVTSAAVRKSLQREFNFGTPLALSDPTPDSLFDSQELVTFGEGCKGGPFATTVAVDATSVALQPKNATTVANVTTVALPSNLRDNPIPFSKIIVYLNARSGKHFAVDGPKSIESRRKILALWKRGYRGKEFRAVIDSKCEQWSDDPQWRPYLRPETLFQASKFEGYLHGEDE